MGSKFNENEWAIIELNYSHPRIGKMQEAEILVMAKALLYRICQSTGWNFPNDERAVKILVNEFRLYLKESCLDLNHEEVAYAIRKYGVDLQDWGRNVNLSLINQAVHAYRQARYVIGNLVKQYQKDVNKPQESLEMQKVADWSEAWEEVKEAAKNGYLKSKIVPVPVYDWLVNKGELVLSVEEKKELMQQVKEQFLTDCLQDARKKDEQRDFYNAIRDKDFSQKKYPEYFIRLANLAKVEAVKQLAKAEAI